MSDESIQSEISNLRDKVEEYAKRFPTVGFEKETMKYKNWRMINDIYAARYVIYLFHESI